MKKCKFNNMMIIIPRSSYDLEDIVRNLQEREVSILVNMSKCNIKTNVVDLIIDYILGGARSYMSIHVKRIFPKVFICFSRHQKI